MIIGVLAIVTASYSNSMRIMIVEEVKCGSKKEVGDYDDTGETGK